MPSIKTEQLEQYENQEKQIELVDKTIKELQEEAHHYFSGNRIELIKQIAHHYKREWEESERKLDNAKEDIIRTLIAISSIIEYSIMGCTHKEKDARLRGVYDFVDTKCSELEKNGFRNWINKRWERYHMFHDSHETRNLKEAIYKKDYEIEYLKKELDELKKKEADTNAQSKA